MEAFKRRSEARAAAVKRGESAAAGKAVKSVKAAAAAAADPRRLSATAKRRPSSASSSKAVVPSPPTTASSSSSRARSVESAVTEAMAAGHCLPADDSLVTRHKKAKDYDRARRQAAGKPTKATASAAGSAKARR